MSPGGWLFGIVAFALASVAAYVFRRIQQPNERLEEVRRTWGRAKRSSCDDDQVALYHRLLEEEADAADAEAGEGENAPREPALDDRTWADLYMDAILRQVDHAGSTVGKQVLYRMLRTPLLDTEALAQRDRGANALAQNEPLRERLQVQLSALSSPDAAALPHLFLGELPERPWFAFVFQLLSFSIVAGLASLFFAPRLLVLVVPIALTNLVTASFYKQNIASWIQPLRSLSTLLAVSEHTQAIVATCQAPSAGDAGGDVLRAALQPCAEGARTGALRSLRRRTAWLTLEQSRGGGDPLSLLCEYGNLLFLADVNIFFFSLETIERHRPLLHRIYTAVGNLDAMISIASYRESLPRFARPAFREPARALRIDGAMHPLLAAPVTNSLHVDNASVFVTGSNMSGKTTFLRTIAVNVVLAQTLYTCTAAAYEAPPLRILSCIGRTDSLAEGKSYYLAEVERIGLFLQAAAERPQCLFVLDEIYRGTNTVERVAAAKAVLDALNSGRTHHLVMVTTHDVEISGLLQTAWDRFHFRESVVDGELTFDYRLRPGTSSTRNALLLLEAAGYPKDVIADARATAEQVFVTAPAVPMAGGAS
jgi:hypothetical protein